MTKLQLTKESFVKLSKELKDAKIKEQDLLAKIEYNSESDEEGENPLAVQLKEELELVSAHIEELEEGLLKAEIVTEKKKYDTVQLGADVTVKVGRSQKTFSIVSHFESNPSLNKISQNSPLGLALSGKKVGETAELTAPAGKVSYTIVAIA